MANDWLKLNNTASDFYKYTQKQVLQLQPYSEVNMFSMHSELMRKIKIIKVSLKRNYNPWFNCFNSVSESF